MQNKCKGCSSAFVIEADQELFLKRVAESVLPKGESFPLPDHCPQCRQQRRFSWRNDSHYYRRTCAACGKAMVSMYSPDKQFAVVCSGCFWSDTVDATGCAIVWNPKESFFAQFRKLQQCAPRLSVYNTQSENSEYTVHSSRNRNCYMGSSLVDDEDVYYSDFTFESRQSMDLFSCGKVELCYECIFCDESYNCDYCRLCTNCNDCVFSFDCRGSARLVGCVGLRNKQNHILNRPASAEECNAVIQKIKTDPTFRADFQKKAEELRMKHPHRDAWMFNAEHCTGNYQWNCKNVQNGYNIRKMEDVHYAYEGHSHKDTWDTTRIANGELVYDSASIVDLKNSAFCNLTYQCDHLLYCDNCHGCSECFGCIGLKKKKFCILNKQYTEQEYRALVPKIIAAMRSAEEWGGYFPTTLSPFAYNESKAQEWFPLTKEEVLSGGWPASRSAAKDSKNAHLRPLKGDFGGQPSLREGWKWHEDEQPVDVQSGKRASEFSSSVAEVPADVTQEILLCETTGKPFKIFPQEFEFYQKKGLPLPRKSPHQRRLDRQALQYPTVLHTRTCHRCKTAITTTYPPSAPEIVYCEKCYLETVY